MTAMKRRMLAATLALTAAAAGCGAATCAGRAICGNAAWPVAEGGRVGGSLIVAPAVDVAADGLAAPTFSERVPVGGTSVSSIRFDVASLHARGAVIERAVLSLAPDASWHPGAARVRLFARAIDPSASATQPGSDADGEVSLPPFVRTPVRIDVTRSVRACARRGACTLALGTDGDPVVFAGPADAIAADRPRLEVVVR